MKRKNLVFFMTDQQRFDTLGLQVGDQPVASHMTQFAKDNIEYQRAYNTCPICVPSRTALATGKNPIANKMCYNDFAGTQALPHETIHTLLAQRGYEIAHIGVDHIRVDPPLKERFSFAAWEDNATYNAYAKTQGITTQRSLANTNIIQELQQGEYIDQRYSSAGVTLWEHELKDFKDIWFTDQAVHYLKQPKKKPFALFLYLWAPHPPLIVPPEYLNLFPWEKIVLPQGTDAPAVGEPVSRRKGIAAQMGEYPPEKGWKQGWSAHCALTRLCDDQFARVLKTLGEQQLLDDTIVTFTTDHGEFMGQNRMYQKMEMYEAAVRVPALFSVPGAPKGSYRTPISHLDFLPTVLELLDIEPKDTYEGQSLAPFLQKGQEPLARDIFGSYSGNHALGDIRRMIVRWPWKYVWDEEQGELYQLEKDPNERTNLSGNTECTRVEKELHQALSQWSKENEDFVSYQREFNQ